MEPVHEAAPMSARPGIVPADCGPVKHTGGLTQRPCQHSSPKKSVAARGKGILNAPSDEQVLGLSFC